MTTTDAPSYGDALTGMAATERLARRTLRLLNGSLFTPPDDRDDLSLWFADHIERLSGLSGGERVLFATSLAIWNGVALHDPDQPHRMLATVAELHRLDADNRRAVGAIISEWLS